MSGRSLMFGIFCVLIAVSVLRSAESTDDYEKLQGSWIMVSGIADGEPMPDEMVKGGRRVCKANQTTVTMNGQLFMKATFTLDPMKSPKAIDYTMTGGFTEGKRQFGIYKIVGGQVTFCFGRPGADRPTSFESKAGDGQTLSVWRRAKPSETAPSR